MLEVKWKADPSQGKGFKANQNPSLFGEILIEYDRNLEVSFLKTKVLEALESKPQGLSNVDMYILCLSNSFLPKHIIKVLKELKSAKRVTTYNLNDKESNFGNAHYIDYYHFKNGETKIFFKVKRHGTI